MTNKKRIAPVCLLLVAALCCVFGAFLLTPKRAEAQVNEVVSISALDGTAGNSGEGYANLLDGKKSAGKKGTNFTKWCVNFTAGNEVYVVFDAAIATKMSGYTLVTGNDNDENVGRNPKDWVLYGCNDYDTTAKSGTWTALHTVADDTTMKDVNFTSYHFDIPTESQGQYRYYKFVVSAIKSESGSGVFQLCEMSFDYENFITVLSETDAVDSAETAEKLFDGKKTSDNASKWCFKMPTTGNAHVIFKTKQAVIVSEYTFVTGNDNSSAKGRNPKDWVLYACNDYDEAAGTGTWTTLHEVTEDEILQDENFTEYSFTVPSENKASYQYYKLEIGANKGGNLVQIGEMELTYSTCDHAWIEGSPTEATCTDPAYKNYTCSVCGATKREANGVANGHTWGTTSEDEATCTEAKKIHQTCSVCKATQTLTEGDANGHEWQVTKQIDANCTSKQHIHFICENCSQTKVEEIGTALGHVFEDGRCVRCGMINGTAQSTAGDFVMKGGTAGVDYKFENGVLKILSSTHLTISNADQTTATTNRIYVEKNISANVTLAGVNINVGVTEGKTYYDDNLQLCAFEIAKDSEGDIIITLAEGSKNFMMSGAYHAGIEKIGESGSLLIDGTGALEVYGGPYGAGIGSGGRGVPTGFKIANITIKDCEIYAAGASMNYKNADGTYRNVLIHNTTSHTIFSAPGIGVGGSTSYSGYSDSDLNIDGNITLINARVTTYSIGCSSIGPVGKGYVNNIKIINSSLKSLYYWGFDGTTYDTSSILWSYNGQIGSLLIAGGASDGKLPKNEAGDEVHLLKIENPNGDIVKIDGEYYPIVAHSSTDTNIYAYVTGKTHTVQVGTSVYTYTFGDTTKYSTDRSVFSKSETVGTAEALKAFSVEAKNSGDTIVLGEDYTYESGVLTITSDKEMIISSSGIKTTDKIVINSQDANITLKNVNIDVSSTENACALEIASASLGDICIELLGENTLKSGKNKAGLQNSSNATLTICGSGKMSAYGGENGAGIGGGRGVDGNNITISGTVKILAIGGMKGAGIGGGYGGSALDITISGGVISARGGLGGAGIGTGCSFDEACIASNITISGGTIFVEGGKANADEDIGAGAGLGSGFGGSATNITISGGCVKIVSDANLVGGVEATTPVNVLGEDVFLLTILNVDCENVLIDGAPFSPTNLHALGDDNLFVYLTGSDHTIRIGDDEKTYHFDETSETFFLCAKSENISFDVTGHWHSCVDEDCDEQFDFCAHTFDQQLATNMYLCTSADCTHKATYYYSCMCGHYGTDTFESGEPLGHDYVWVQIKKGSYEGHFKVCENCNDQILVGEHIYDQKIEADEYFCKGADCTHKATYYYSCVCGHCGTQTFEVGTALGHDYSDDWSTDGTGHWKACTREGCDARNPLTEGNHTYYSNCDTTCDDCGYVRPNEELVHNTISDFVYDENGHWHQCYNPISPTGGRCSVHVEYAQHTYNNGRYVTIDGKHHKKCDTCEYYDANLGENCVFIVKYNTNSHWHECCFCGVKNGATSDHEFDNACDTTCNHEGCGYTRTTSHKYAQNWLYNDDTHWHQCAVCGDKKDEAAHTFGYAHNGEYHWEKCSFCGCTKDADEHEYDDDDDVSCNVCEYVRPLSIKQAKFTYSGYVVDGEVWDFKVAISSDTTGLCWDDDEDYDHYWWIITNYEQYMTASTYDNYVDEYDHAYFFPNTTYWVGLYLEADDGYNISSLNATDILIEGLGTAIFVSHSSYGNYAYAYFELPKLDGDSTILSVPMLSFSLVGHEVGARIYDMTLTPGEGNIPIDSFGYYVSANGYDVDEDDDDVFGTTLKYEFNFWIDAPDGYCFFDFSADMLSIAGLGEPTNFGISPGGGYIYATYLMPSLLGEHDHVWDAWTKDSAGHWHECEDCFGVFDYAEHIYDDDEDTTCNVCGYVRKFQVSKVEYEMSGFEFEGLVARLVVLPTDAEILSGTYGQAYVVCTDESCVYFDFSSIITDSSATFMEKQTYYLVVIIGSLTYDLSTLSKGDITLGGVGKPVSLAYDSRYNYSYAIFELAKLYAPHTHTGTWIQQIPATCSQTGTKGHRICDVCGKCVDENGVEITDLVVEKNLNAHSFGQWVEETSATCCEVGTKGHKDCSLCHKHFDENGNEIIDLVLSIDEHAHSFGSWVEEIPATCSQTGTKGHKACAHCGKNYDESGNEITDLVIEKNANAHSFGQWIKEIPATTESQGTKAHKDCSNCSKHFDEDGVEIVDLSIQKLDAKLSGGAIAGIAIACVVVLNFGTFALVWFVIKKKKFADMAKILRKR